MSKPNTQHIIGFTVKQYNVELPTIINLFVFEGVYEAGVFESEVFE